MTRAHHAHIMQTAKIELTVGSHGVVNAGGVVRRAAHESAKTVRKSECRPRVREFDSWSTTGALDGPNAMAENTMMHAQQRLQLGCIGSRRSQVKRPL